MDDNKLAELAGHYAKHLMTEWVTWARKDSWSDTPAEFTAADVIESHKVLTEAIPTYEGKTIEVECAVSIIDDEGNEIVTPLDRVKAEHIDSAQAHLAAQFHCLYTQTHLILTTFAGLDRLRNHLAEETTK
ncbi:hypothetical protein [Nonomuraea sp. NPDC049158]|uniref:hypothetical protein n=1 Tax=Nonomuraea sp. NPDC049158 TaxID=3155649 RepID=UPI0033F613D3